MSPLIALLLYQLCFYKSLAADSCSKNIVLSDEMHGKALVNHTFQTVSVIDNDGCQLYCFMDDRCISYNFYQQLEICNLSSSDHIMHPGHLVKRPNALYYRVKNNCDCISGNVASCTVKGGTHQCHCKPGFTGKQCETIIVPQCKSVPLGMQSKDIPDSKINASSHWSTWSKPSNARLHMNSYGWLAKGNTIGQWLQVDLSKVTTITGIATQGNKKVDYWVNSYSLQYSLDGRTFHKYQAGKVFDANVDRNSVVKHDLNPTIHAQYIRLYPKRWHRWPAMRMELYGCK